MNRRELLLALLAGPLAARSLDGAEPAGQSGAATELVCCGWDEVFILALGEGASPTQAKIWSWRAADRPEIPTDVQPLFRTTDDCKPIEGGRRILISSSGGAIALVDRETRRALFHTRVTNSHSIEILPGGRIAAAASVSTAASGNRIVIFDPASGQELASDTLRSAHGLVWDQGRGVLWALGGDVLRGYDVGTTAATTRLNRTFELALPDTDGHDLTAVPDSPRLFLSTGRHCWYFDRNTRQITPHDTLADMPRIKSYGVHPRTGRVAYLQAEGGNWWTENLHLQHPDGALHLPGEHLYKVRWN